MTKVNISFEVEVNPLWIEVCTQYSDIFSSGTSGYWMCGMKHDDKLGWLCYEFEHSSAAPAPSKMEGSPEYKAIIKAWKAGEKLPDHWYRLNKETAIKAWAEGVKRYGVDWYQYTDGTRDDVVIQMALLGDIVYG